MSIATKNGSVIVKDGSIGTECGCCGEWYCCTDLYGCPTPPKVTVAISASDVWYRRIRTAGACTQYGNPISPVSEAYSAVNHAGALSGTHVLNYVGSANQYTYSYSKSFQDSLGCDGPEILVTVVGSPSSVRCSSVVIYASEYAAAKQVASDTPPQPVPLSGMSCEPTTTRGADGCRLYDGKAKAQRDFNPSTGLFKSGRAVLVAFNVPAYASGSHCLPPVFATAELKQLQGVLNYEFALAGDASVYAIVGGTITESTVGSGQELKATVTISIE